MNPTDQFTLSWCSKHQQWWVTNCPDCMAEAVGKELLEKIFASVTIEESE